MSAYEVALKQAIMNHYLGQRGSGAVNFPVFRGSHVQYGNGIGDIFKAIGRFLLPIFASSAKTFVSSAAQGLSEGHNLKEASLQALKPTLTSAAQDTTEKLFKKVTGRGRGRPKKKADGTLKAVYKRAPKKRKPAGKAIKNSKQFIPTNF